MEATEPDGAGSGHARGANYRALDEADAWGRALATLKRITASPNSGAPVTESVADYRDTIHSAIRATTTPSIPL